MQKHTIASIVRLLGRELSWRLGRALYTAAREEGENNMESNGERLLLQRLAALSARERRRFRIVDCGANLGDWTAMAKQCFADARGADCALHAIEPSPATLVALRQRYQGDDTVRVHDVAFSDCDGTADFFLVAPTGGRNSLAADLVDPVDRVSVRTVRADTFLPAHVGERIDLLKIDAEGHDYTVMEGSAALLASRRVSVLQFEYNWRWLTAGRSMHSVFKLAAKYGYQVARAGRAGIVGYVSWNAELDRYFEWNYLLVAPEMVQALGIEPVRWSASNTLVPA
jgi:FkbM family methyltransferase